MEEEEERRHGAAAHGVAHHHKRQISMKRQAKPDNGGERHVAHGMASWEAYML